MKNRCLSDMELSSLCGELSLLIHAGVGAADGLSLLAEEERGGAQRELLSSMAREADCGTPLSAVMRQTGRFPLYVVGLVEVGERSGHLEEALQALSRRSGSRAARVLSGIAGDLRREERRLSTAHFLITGERYSPSQAGAAPSGPLPLALRTLFQQLHQRAAQARAAAQGMGDPCLQQLFQDLAEDAEFYAQRLRALLEEIP